MPTTPRQQRAARNRRLVSQNQPVFVPALQWYAAFSLNDQLRMAIPDAPGTLVLAGIPQVVDDLTGNLPITAELMIAPTIYGPTTAYVQLGYPAVVGVRMTAPPNDPALRNSLGAYLAQGTQSVERDATPAMSLVTTVTTIPTGEVVVFMPGGGSVSLPVAIENGERARVLYIDSAALGGTCIVYGGGIGLVTLADQAQAEFVYSGTLWVLQP